MKILSQILPLSSLFFAATPLAAAPFVSTINRQPQTTLAISGASTVFRVIFTENVTGVDVTDFILVKIGTATGTIASVSGSGTSYDVTVNSISGFGQLRLDLKGSGTGIINGASTAITGGFYNGQTITFGTYVPVGWGTNSIGQLGDSSTASPRSIPVATTVSGLLNGKNTVSLANGGAHTLALTSDNLIYTWGQGSSGQLGDGQPITSYSSSTPVAVTMSGVLSGKTIVAVACGSTHSLALDSAGLLYAWGNNAGGQLGDGLGGSGLRSNVPVAVLTNGVLSGKTITGMAGGGSFTIVCTSDGGVYTWGQGSSGQLGNGTITTTNVAPLAVTTSGVLSGKRIVAVAAGSSFAAVLSSDGRVYTWGSNNQGQLGDGSTTASLVPIAVSSTGLPGGKTIANIFCGNQVVYALATDGTLYAWGNNLNGALGIGSLTSSSTPVVTGTFGALSGKTITTLGTGNSYAYALTTEGKVYSWGINTASQLGDGTTTDRTSPVAVDVSSSSALNGKTVGFVSGGSQGSFGMVAINAVAPNTAPTISNVANQSTSTGTATSSIAITIGDAETSVASLTMSGSSSNTSLVPNANIVFGGSGANRSVIITPAAGQNGTTTLTLSVTDAGSLTATDAFVLTVSDTTPPTVTSIVRQTPTTQATTSTSATFRVTFSEAINAPSTSNFAVTAVNSSSIVGTMNSVTAVNTSTYDVAVTITSGTGEFRLKVID